MAAERTWCLTCLHIQEEMRRVAKDDATVGCNRIITHQDHFRYARSPGSPSQLGCGWDTLVLYWHGLLPRSKNQDDRVRELRRFAALK